MTQKELELINFVHLFNNPWVVLMLTVLIVWTLIWKGIALWKAGRNNQMVWFIVMLMANTAGILEIIYIFFFSKQKEIKKV